MLIHTLVTTAILLPSVVLAEVSPYAGQQNRDIKALSEEQIDGLLQGRGMEMAKPAELNSYPGPSHTLDLATDLGLSLDQVEALEQVRARMSAEAQALGAEIVREEQLLDRMFAEGSADAAEVEALTLKIGALLGQLRAVHLNAHIETTAILTADQIHRYGVLRGYTDEAATQGHGGSGTAGHEGH